MGYIWKQWLTDPGWMQSLVLLIIHNFRSFVDIGLVLAVTYMMLVIIGERRTLMDGAWFYHSDAGGCTQQTIGPHAVELCAEQSGDWFCCRNGIYSPVRVSSLPGAIGTGEILQLFQSSRRTTLKAGSVTDEIVDAVKELSQNRTGALLILETGSPIDERDFSVPGVKLNADVSKELIQTIFQTTTLLHDGAVLIRDARVVAAGVILPLSERTASRQLGTRHRAAMGITERVENCVCVVVSEETGSISLAERGTLNRPLTSSKQGTSRSTVLANGRSGASCSRLP